MMYHLRTCKTTTMMQMEEEEECACNYNNNYYVQSPSSIMSHANSTTESELWRSTNNPHQQQHHHSPLPLQELEEDESYSYPTKPLLNHQTTTTFTNLSRCSSSRASTTFFCHQNDNDNGNDKMMMMMTLLPSPPAHHSNILQLNSGAKIVNNSNIIVPAANKTGLRKVGKVDGGDYKEKWYGYDGENDEENISCWQYFSFSTYNSYVWIALQLLWRFLLSLMLAFLVFYLATKPPPPHLSLKITRVNQFELAEGLDLTGVATNFLSCNISLALTIDNRSKVFGLYSRCPLVDIYFGRVPLVLSKGPEMHVRSQEWREIEIFGGTKKKAMYGGGRNMEDMLNSDQGLPLLITLTSTSYFQVIPNFIHSQFHHHAHCLLLLHNFYDKKHRTQAYNSTCLFT